MLVCQYVIVCHIVGHPISEERKALIRQRASRSSNILTAAGACSRWRSTTTDRSSKGARGSFTPRSCYVALRLLDCASPDDPLCREARSAGSATHGGVYQHPDLGPGVAGPARPVPVGRCPADPSGALAAARLLPAHPRRLYCHMRLIYLGLSYLYGTKFVAPADATVDALRRELYPEGYDESAFERHRETIAATDLYEAPSKGLRIALRALRAVDGYAPSALRRKGLARAMEHIRFEFESTDFVCLSPVNGFLFCLSLFVSDPHHPWLGRALEGMEYWVWEDEDLGTRFCGARSDIWDTSFLVQALCEGPRTPLAREIVRDACHWLPIAQLQADIPGGSAHYREPAKERMGLRKRTPPVAGQRLHRRGPRGADASPVGRPLR